MKVTVVVTPAYAGVHVSPEEAGFPLSREWPVFRGNEWCFAIMTGALRLTAELCLPGQSKLETNVCQ